MVNQQLSDYVRQQLQQGKSKDEIKSELLEAGWQEADINQALGMSGYSQPPRPPVPPTLPSFTSTGLQQLDPKAVWVFFFRFVFGFLITFAWFGLIFGLAFSDTIAGFLGIGLLTFSGIVVLAFIWAKLTYHFYRYELTEEGFRKELGVIFKKYVTIPYERIQNVNVNRGIIDRILGLSSLNIFTAGTASMPMGRYGLGGAAAEGLLPGLSKDAAEELRNQLVHLSRQSRGQGF